MLDYRKVNAVPLASSRKGANVRKDDITSRELEIRLIFPPIMQRYEGTTLHELYLELSKRHVYEAFELLGGDKGARMSTTASRDLQVLVGRVILSERIHRPFDALQKDVIDIINTVQKQLKIPEFALPYVEWEALWPTNSGINVGEAMKLKFLSISGDQFELLSPAKLKTVGLSFECVRPNDDNEEEGHSAIYEFEFLPWEEDPTQLHLRVTAHYHDRVANGEKLAEFMEDAYNFMMEKVTNFVLALAVE